MSSLPLEHLLTPLVSVLLPVRDAAAALPVAIASIRAQSCQEWELLVVDDGSTDGSGEIAEAAMREDGRIRVWRRSAEGLVAALNHVLAQVRGSLVARMDADDVAHPERLAEQVALLNRRPEIGVTSCRVGFGGEAGVSRGYAEHVRWLNTLVSPEAMAMARFIESPLAHPSAMFRRELVEQLGGYRDGAFPEDYELWLRWFDAGVKFAKVERELLTWNDPPGRLSRTDPRYSPEAFYAVKCDWLGRHLDRAVSSERPVWLWGAGRVTRRRFRALESAFRPLAGFIDIDPKKIGGVVGGRPVVGPEGIPRDAFVLSGVGNRGARGEVVACLRAQGRMEGADFLCVA